MQTAVEWLVEQILHSDDKATFGHFIKQAKEMEKKQIVKSNFDGQRLHAKSITSLMMQDNAESYYSEMYKNEK